jgi:hypothetical protein
VITRSVDCHPNAMCQPVTATVAVDVVDMMGAARGRYDECRRARRGYIGDGARVVARSVDDAGIREKRQPD